MPIVNPVYVSGSETPEISVSSSGLITATAGMKSATKQLTTKSATTITPMTSSQTAVSSGVYTTGNVIVSGDSNLLASNIKNGVSIFGVTGTLTSSSTWDVYSVTINNNSSYQIRIFYIGVGSSGSTGATSIKYMYADISAGETQTVKVPGCNSSLQSNQIIIHAMSISAYENGWTPGCAEIGSFTGAVGLRHTPNITASCVFNIT